MSLPDRNNPYNFNEFLDRRNRFDFYADDPYLQKIVRRYAGNNWQVVDQAARRFSATPSIG